MANMQGPFVPKSSSPQSLSLWPQSARASEPILLCMVANVNHETQNDAAYHARANCGSLKIHTGEKRQKNRDPWKEQEQLRHNVRKHETGRNDHLLQASGGVAVRAR